MDDAPRTGLDMQVSVVRMALRGEALAVAQVEQNSLTWNWALIRHRVLRDATSWRLPDNATDILDRWQQGEFEAAANGTAPDGPIFRRGSDVSTTVVDWLWRHRVALGSITLLVGVPGLGKTMLACWLAARATRGTLDGDLSRPINVCFCTAEDSIEHTIVPRMVAAGADLERVYFVAMRRHGMEEGVMLPDDVGTLGVGLAERDAGLLVIDPLMAHLNPDADSHRDQSVRTALAPLHRIAESCSASVLLLGHLNKKPDNDLFSRVGGSIGLTGAARNVLLMTPDPDAPEDDSARVLVHGKGNLGPKAPTIRLRLRVDHGVAGEDGRPIETAVVELGEDAPHLHVADALSPPQSEEERSEVHDAMEFLIGELEDGPRPSTKVMMDGKRLGHSERTLKRARKKLGIVARKLGISDGWVLELSAKGATQREPQAHFGESKGAGPELRSGTGPTPLGPIEEGQPKKANVWPSSENGKIQSDDFCAAGCGRPVGRPGVTCARCQIEQR